MNRRNFICAVAGAAMASQLPAATAVAIVPKVEAPKPVAGLLDGVLLSAFGFLTTMLEASGVDISDPKAVAAYFCSIGARERVPVPTEMLSTAFPAQARCWEEPHRDLP